MAILNNSSTLEKLCNLGNIEHLSRGQTNWSNESLEHDVYWVLGLGSFEAQQLRLSHGLFDKFGIPVMIGCSDILNLYEMYVWSASLN